MKANHKIHGKTALTSAVRHLNRHFCRKLISTVVKLCHMWCSSSYSNSEIKRMHKHFQFCYCTANYWQPWLIKCTTLNNVIIMLKVCYHFCPLLKLLSLSRELKQCAINLVLCSILLMLSFETARSDNKCRTILMAWNRRWNMGQNSRDKMSALTSCCHHQWSSWMHVQQTNADSTQRTREERNDLQCDSPDRCWAV